MVRNMFASTAVVLAGIAGFAAAATYEDFTLDTTVALNYAAPASVISTNFGTIDDLKTACDAVDDCLGVAYRK